MVRAKNAANLSFNPFERVMLGWHTQPMVLCNASELMDLQGDEDFDCIVSKDSYKDGLDIEIEETHPVGLNGETDTITVKQKLFLRKDMDEAAFKSWLSSLLPDRAASEIANKHRAVYGNYRPAFKTSEDLPPEFFLHDAYDLRLGSKPHVCDFVSTWGITCSPFRLSSLKPKSLASYKEPTSSLAPIVRRNIDGMKKTDALRRGLEGQYKECPESNHRIWNDETKSVIGVEPCGPVAYVALEEVTAALELMKHITDWTQDIIRHQNSPEVGMKKNNPNVPWSLTVEGEFMLNLINSISLAPHLLVQSYSSSPKDVQPIDLPPAKRASDAEFIRAAICQFVDTLTDQDVPWKECASDTCNKMFKHQHTLRTPKRGSHADAMYCSRHCADNQAHRKKK